VSKVYPLAFYNLRVGRSGAQVEKELRAMLSEWRPAILGLCEATGYALPGIKDYVLLRDTSSKSRANIAAYVKASLSGPDKIKWHDCQETWSRTEHPGTHEPRSWLEFRAGALQALIGHQPPKGTDNTKAAQKEGIDLCVRRMAPWTRSDWEERSQADKNAAKAQARISLADWNRRPGEDGPGPTQLAGRIGGFTIGAKIDGGVARSAKLVSVSYPQSAGSCRLCSDHDCAFLCKIEVAA